MTRIDLHHVDLNLLVIFDMMMLERNVTRAAERLSMGLPEVRDALARLQSLCNDVLFVPLGQHWEPSPQAVELYNLLRPAFDAMSTVISESSRFDPAISQDTIRLGLGDGMELGLLPALLRQLSVEAPHMTTVIRRTHYLSVSQQLSSGEITLGICYSGKLPGHAKRRTLGQSQSVMVRADRNTAPVTLDQYCARPHALVSATGDLSGFIDQALSSMGRHRQVKLSIPDFHELGLVLPGTTLIATVPEYAASALAANGSLRIQALPFHVPVFDISMSWNATQDRDPAQRWLRRKVLECWRDIR